MIEGMDQQAELFHVLFHITRVDQEVRPFKIPSRRPSPGGRGGGIFCKGDAGKMPAPQRAFPHAGLLAGGEGEEERDGVRRNYARHSGAIPMRAGIESLVSVQRLHAKDAFKPALGFSPGMATATA